MDAQISLKMCPVPYPMICSVVTCLFSTILYCFLFSLKQGKEVFNNYRHKTKPFTLSLILFSFSLLLFTLSLV
jgi:succinate dehydrogenase/fumarate reductase cytochrome b subunit